MRNIYIQTGNHIPIQQGTIINGCISDNYTEGVYGIIITPRCDIGNGGKVPTIHYLPIISLEKWIQNDCKNSAIQKERKKLDEMLRDLGISSNILDIIKIQDIEKIQIPQQSLDRIKVYFSSKNGGNINSPQIINHIKEDYSTLIKGQHNRYYLIEDWNNPNKYNVILLREIKRLSYQTATKYTDGFQARLINEDEFNTNDIIKTTSNFNFHTVATIGSPYIEHIIQAFSYNFCRIGINNIDENELSRKYQIIDFLKNK